MTTIDEIEDAVAHLPQTDLNRFRSWFDEFDANAWDKHFEEDVHNGKLDALADQALEDISKGRCSKL